MGLVDKALERLASDWGATPARPVIHVEHHERAVFEATGPHGPCVVKIDTDLAKHRKEVAVLSRTGRVGLPVPRVLRVDEGPPAILVLQRLAGDSLAGAGPTAWRDAGRRLRRLHDLDPPAGVGVVSPSGRSWSEHFVWWANHEHDLLIARGGVAPDRVRRMHRILEEAFEAMVLPYRLIRRIGSASWMREHGYDDDADLRAAEKLSA